MIRLLAKSHIKKDWKQNIIFIAVFTCITVFFEFILSITLESGTMVGNGIVIVSLLYGIMIVSVMFEMKVLLSKNLWKRYDELGITKNEAAQILLMEDGILLGISVLLGIVLGEIIRKRIYYSSVNFVVLIMVCLGIMIFTFLCAYGLQLKFLFSHIWNNDLKNQEDINYKIEGVPLFIKNVIREKKKMVSIVTIITLGIVIFNTTYVILKSDNSQVYLNKAIHTDFILTGIDTSSNLMRQKEQYVAEDDISKIESSPHFEEGGRIYHNLENKKILLKTNLLPETSKYPLFYGQEFEKMMDDLYFVNTYGADDFIFSNMEMIEGELDLEKLNTGKYVVYGLERNATMQAYVGEVEASWKYFSVGDKITIVGMEKEQEYEIMCICIINHAYSETNNYTYPGHELTFYLPSKEYLTYGEDKVMRYTFNATDDVAMEQQLEGLKYESAMGWKTKYEKDAKTIKKASYVMCFACVGIGIFVYCNTILISILSRKREFTILQDIGMTKRQLAGMLLGEGMVYALVVAVVSIGSSVLLALLCKAVLNGISWNYMFSIEPALIATGIVGGFNVVIPLVMYLKVGSRNVKIRN